MHTLQPNILYLDQSVLVCHKPADCLSEGNGSSCLPRILSDLLRESGERTWDVLPVHRLDRETEGVMVFARTQRAAASLSRTITEGKTEKEYLAVLRGIPAETEASLSDLLFYDRKRGKSYVVTRERKGVKRALLDYSVMKIHPPYSLVRVKLHTGRTHQIRVQFASRSLPLRGDRKYGAPREDSPLLLCACRLRFPHPETGKLMEFVTTPQAPAWQEWQLPT